MMRELSADDKKFLIDAYDHRVFRLTGEFHDPAAHRLRTLERIFEQLQRINGQEPKEHEQRVLVVKRLFRPPIVIDAPPLAAWKTLKAEAQAAFDQTYLETKTFLERQVYADKQLLRDLDQHRRQFEKQRLEDERAAQERAAHDKREADYKKAESTAAERAKASWRKYENARVRRINKEQAELHDYLERKDRRWRDT